MEPRTNLSRRPPHCGEGSRTHAARAPISTTTTAFPQPQPPVRYVDVSLVNEKVDIHEIPLDTLPQPKEEVDHQLSPRPRTPSRQSSLPSHRSSSRSPSACRHTPSIPCSASTPYPAAPSPSLFASPQPSLHSNYTHAPRRLRFYALIRPWIPLLLYLSTSLGFLIAIAFWKTEVFTALDELSAWLKDDAHFGFGVLFCLIFLTTFPNDTPAAIAPLPMYSTLIVLSGYTFGAWAGAALSYCAALSGAVVVFLLSRYLFRDAIARCLASAASVKQVVRAIEKRPKLLFCIRLAPYPYNVMNCLLAASPTLTLKTYIACTALSLFKLIIHTTLGSSIHSFARYHLKTGADADSATAGTDEEDESPLRYYSTIGGIVLCVAIFVYISYVARKAVTGQLEDDDALPSHTDEEATAFLSSSEDMDEEENADAGVDVDVDVEARAASPMAEMPFRAASVAVPMGRAWSPSPSRGRDRDA
ncbi:hypothetical protein EVG20_g525 [Dentipellis fragilis]|uniref:Golgi apparatus membrane protein TVP38 n=1 Tax=Dentipellis fragilis TaxID=205917 RepID=A0A4Y9ZDH7_9AGAM|nr:hypothetical protein EVG20_g525 [Dentipellis fragilis]